MYAPWRTKPIEQRFGAIDQRARRQNEAAQTQQLDEKGFKKSKLF
jgi:hypothetical protein